MKMSLVDTTALSRRLRYVSNGVQNRQCDKSARLAVLSATYPRSHSDADIEQSALRLLTEWRYRVQALGVAGWRPACNELFKLLNCCHSMVFMRATDVDVAPQPLRCGRRRICPFCYANDVVVQHQRIARWLRRRQDPVRLVVLSENEYGTFSNFGKAFTSHQVAARKAVRDRRAIAALVRIVAEPLDGAEWVIRRRLLLAVPVPGKRVGKLVRGDNASLKVLTGRLGAASRYPVGLLRSPRVEDISQFLSVRVRGVKTMGEWYNMTETDGSQDDQ